MVEIKVQMKPGEDPNKVQGVMNRSIFRPEEAEGKKMGWFRAKVTKWLHESKPGLIRFYRVHRLIKLRFAYPGLKLARWMLGKHMVTSLDKINEGWWNNHIRMYYWSCTEGLKDMWQKMYYDADPSTQPGANEDEFFEITKHNNKSHIFRQIIVDVMATEMCEDTIDREW